MTTASMATAEPLLSIRNATKRYGEGDQSVLALDNVSLDLEGGKIYGLLGPNGAGKTTLLRMCATLLSPTAGDIWVAQHHTVNDARSVRRQNPMTSVWNCDRKSSLWERVMSSSLGYTLLQVISRTSRSLSSRPFCRGTWSSLN